MSGAITGFVTGGMTSSHCFVAGTLVETIDGPIPIEQIEEGEFVLSEDPETGDVTYKRVLETYVNETNELVHLNIDGEEVVTTAAHPFYVKDLGFVLAGDLDVGATLIDSEGNELHLQIKRWEYLQSPVPIYNFAVEDYHTYFVGTKNVLVHNICGEQILDSQPTHDLARKSLVNELDQTGAFTNGSKPFVGSLEKSYGNGKVIGRMSLDGKVRWRLDYDPTKGVHYNIENFLNGKGANAIKKVIPIDISFEEYVKIIDLWN